MTFALDPFRRSVRMALAIAATLFTALGLATAPAAADEPHPFELTAFGGYRVGGRYEVDEGRLALAEGFSYGGSFGYRVNPDLLVDVTYTRQDTDLDYQPLDSGQATPVADMTVQGLYLGAVYEHGMTQTRPFAGMGLGASRLDPDTEGVDSQTRFSFNFSGGLRTDLGKQVGLKFALRGTFTTPPDDGSTIICDSSSGFCYVQAGNSVISQFDFSVGLAIRL